MEIVRYEDQYEADVFRLVKDFHAESLNEYGLAFNEQALTDTIKALRYEAYLLVVDGKAQGLITGKEVATPSSLEKIWHEMVWFVAKPFRRNGVRLLRTVQKLLKERGFNGMVMVHMHNSKSDQLARFYERLGMTAMETHYIGRL